MRYLMFAWWLAASVAFGAAADEPVPGQPEGQAAESQVAEPQDKAEEEADAEIRRIEEGVSGAGKVEEFVPKKPLSADKAIALPSDI